MPSDFYRFPVVGGGAVLGGFHLAAAEQDASEASETKVLKTRILQSAATVGGRAEVCVPQLRSIVWSMGSTNSGEVIARAANVHARAAAGCQRRTASRRSATMSRG